MINKNIDWYFKKIGEYPSGRPKLAVDFDKLIETEFNFFLIITEREVRVKTYGAKQLAFKDWKEKQDLNTLWLRTKVDEIRPEELLFFKDVPDEIKKEGFKFESHIASNLAGIPFIKMSPVAVSSNRGSRGLIKYIFYDEFNIGVDAKNWKAIQPNFEDILRSVSNQKTVRDLKVFLLGNNKSFNNPLLVNLGINSIDEEVSCIYTQDGKPLILILFPIIDENERKDIEELNADNPVFQFMKISGGAKHAYFNESQYDGVNGIVKRVDNFNELYKYHHNLFRVGDEILSMTNLPENYDKEGYQYHLFCLDLLKPKGIENLKKMGLFSPNITLEPNDKYLTKEMQENLLKCLSLDQISFEDIHTKNLFYKLL